MSVPWHAEEVRVLLSDLPPGQDSALLHLLLCPECRAWATGRLLEEADIRENKVVLPDYDSMWARLRERLPWIVEEATRRTGQAEALLAELLGYPQGQQGKALKEPRFHSFDFLELLLEASHGNQPDEPERSAALADLGGELAVRLLRTEKNETASALYLARAATLRGNACRLQGKLDHAERALGRAGYYLAWPFESWDRAAFCRALGLLRWEQGRLDEAASLLRHAGRTFGEQSLAPEKGASLALLGLLCLEQHRPEAAIGFLRIGRAALDPEARPWLTVRAGLSLALALAEVGQTHRVSCVLQETWKSFHQVSDEREHVRAYWLEGKICTRLGRREEAEHLLSAVRQRLIAEQSLPEVALCSLDLAVLYIESGRAAELPELLRDIENLFEAEEAGLDVTLRVAQAFAAMTAGAQEVSWALVAEAASTLRRVFRSRGYGVERLPFA